MLNVEPRRDPENTERRFLQTYFPRSDGRVLDIGCGDGRLTRLFARSPGLGVGTDIDMDELWIAKSTQSEAVSAKVCFAAAAGEALPFVNELFSMALFSWSL
ncbi:MAG: class I SAM-dependent methyltransferase [Anaerolineales bacterium]|nr:class I SAM-dependent methyltransferase [Chloroflexota bacterium]MBL6982174.1 class I SAM-dependent methyltransferase [Anaerolineales bacterium]